MTERGAARAGGKRGSHVSPHLPRPGPPPRATTTTTLSTSSASSSASAMPAALPTLEQIEDYLQSVQELVTDSLAASTPDLSRVSEAVHRLWQDVLRHSPQAVPASFKGLGAFEVPPPPPPPPPPQTLFDRTADWVADHPWTTVGLGVGVVGAGLLVGYATPRFTRHRARVGARRHAAATSGALSERRQVVIVLGGDSPLGLPLVLDLEKKGYIVITSVSTPEAVNEVESRCHGYVRALVLDPTEVRTS